MAITQNRAVDGDDVSGCYCCGCFKHKRLKRMDAKEVNVDEQQNAWSITFNSPMGTGRYITVIGTTASKCLRFAIDFLCRPANDNIAFHFNPRLEQRYVVRNCRMNGGWGDEETNSLVNFSFAPSTKFVVNFLVTEEEFMVMVNGKHFCSFAHRVPITEITGLEVKGEVDSIDVALDNVTTYPVREIKDLPIVEFDVTHDPDNIESKEMPYTAVLPQSIQPGWQLEIYAKVKLLPHSFYVNLQDGTQHWPHPNIPLHLNPRFSTTVGAYSFVRNSWVNGSWSQEERAPTFPFIPGYSFCMVIRMEANGFTVWIDGQMTAEFPFRSPVPENSISCLYIQGDINLHHVTVRRRIENVYFINPLENIEIL